VHISAPSPKRSPATPLTHESEFALNSTIEIEGAMIATPSRQIDSYTRNKERRYTESLAHDAWTCVESAPQRSVVEGGIGRLGENRRIQTRVSGRGKRQSSHRNNGCIAVSN
jgi:hypothetical protein